MFGTGGGRFIATSRQSGNQQPFLARLAPSSVAWSFACGSFSLSLQQLRGCAGHQRTLRSLQFITLAALLLAVLFSHLDTLSSRLTLMFKFKFLP